MTERVGGGLVTIAEAGRTFGLRHGEALALVRSFNVRVIPSDQRRSVASEPRVQVDEFERAVRCRFRNVDALKEIASLSPHERCELEANERCQVIPRARPSRRHWRSGRTSEPSSVLEIEMNRVAAQAWAQTGS